MYKNEENLIQIYNFMKVRYGRTFAIAVCANIQTETANTFDPQTVQRNKGYTNEEYIRKVYSGEVDFINDKIGFGLFQHTKNGRKSFYWNFFAEHGYRLGDLLGTLYMFEAEIQTTGYGNVRKAIKEGWSLEDCTRIICTEYERPKSMQSEATKEPAIQNRINHAYELKKFFDEKERGKMELSNVTICIDRGHYAKANRSPIVTSYYESDFTWKIGQYLGDNLRSHGIKVIDTRTNKDKDLALVKRGKMANNCLIFLSLHSNACGTESVDHPSIIIPRVEGDVNIEACTILGNRLGANIKAVMGCKQVAKVYSRDAEYDRNGDKKGGNDEYYGVMHGAQSVNCPIYMIVEHGFHTNKANATWLLDDNNVRKLALADANTIVDFIKSYYNMEDIKVDTSNDNNAVTPEVTYKVKKGDTLGAIARAYHTTPEAIREVNKIITDPNLIQPGWVLIIPFEKADLPQYHIVDAPKDGLNSLSKIAKRYGTTTEELKKLNPDVKPPKYIIKNGDKIRIK